MPLYNIDQTILSKKSNAINLLENSSIFEIDKKQLKINADDQALIIDKIIHQ